MNDNTSNNIPASNRDVTSADNVPSGIALPQAIAKIENFPALVAEYLSEEYSGMKGTLAELEAREQTLPDEIASDDEMGEAAKLVKDARDFNKRVEATRVAEKDIYFRSAQACDNMFVPMRDAAARPARTSRPGIMDRVNAKIDAYNQKKLAAEQERRRQEAERAAREAREAEEARRKQEAEAEAARLAAERARNPERQEEKRAVADVKATEAAQVAAAAATATQKAEEAHISTLAKPADMVRQRVEQGATVTMKREFYAVIEDATKLDKDKLWPFIPLAAKEQALRAFAKNTGHSEQMAGARIGSRQVSQVL